VVRIVESAARAAASAAAAAAVAAAADPELKVVSPRGAFASPKPSTSASNPLSQSHPAVHDISQVQAALQLVVDVDHCAAATDPSQLWTETLLVASARPSGAPTCDTPPRVERSC